MKNQNAPVSVLKRVGSSKCLQQQDRKRTNEQQSQSGVRTVTLVNTEDLPSYSTERYYVLSEIEMKAHSIQFLSTLAENDGYSRHLNDDDSDDKTQELSLSSHSLEDHGINVDESAHQTLRHERNSPKAALPPSVLLYLLWRPDCIYNTPSSYAEFVIQPAVRSLMNVYNCPLPDDNQELDQTDKNNGISNLNKPCIYVVIDRIVMPNNMGQIREDIENEDDFTLQQQIQLEQKKKDELVIAEELIRKVSMDSEMKLRHIIKGITVGLSDNVRAAPGLEICMDAIVVGDSERRRFHAKQKRSSTSKRNATTVQDTCWKFEQSNRSSIGLIAEYTDDLTGLDPAQETDAVQTGLNLHVRSFGVWEANGHIMNFALQSQQLWRKYWDDFVESDDDDDYLLQFYSIIMRRGRGPKNKRRTGKHTSKRNAFNDNVIFQSRYLPSKIEQENVEWTANLMVLILILGVGFVYSSTFMDFVHSLFTQTKQVFASGEL